MNKLKTASYAAFTLRLISGMLFIAHGLIKVFVFTFPGTVGFFEKLWATRIPRLLHHHR